MGKKTGQRDRGRGTISGQMLFVFLFAAAVAALAQTPAELSPETAARLTQHIRSGTVEEKRAALFDIRNLRSSAASAVAVPALRDRDRIVRATAASSVVFLPHGEAARLLVPLLADTDEFVRREAAYALGEVGDTLATAPLARLMQNDPTPEVRTAAAIAIGRIGDPSAIDGLVAVLRARPREADEFLRRSTARSIGQIAQKALTGETYAVTPQNFLPDKFKDLGPENRRRSVPVDFSNAVNVLVDVLRNTSEANDTRREAAFALGSIGDARAVPALRTFASAPDPYLAEICREALLKIERRESDAKSEMRRSDRPV
jgi:HEAT repeat protein